MKRGYLVASCGLLACLAAIGCEQILGLDKFTEGDGGGKPILCTPGTQIDCKYSGPAATEGVGPCRAGVKTCLSDGSGFGACENEFLPAASEDCSNNVDDDCNGTVNDGCPCIPGDQQPCYSGPSGTLGVGICHGGTQTCNPDGMGYGACVGEQVPKAEDCTTAGDDDCNGMVNEAAAGCACEPGSTASCYSGPSGTAGVGICHEGTQTCNPDGMGYGACAGEQVPKAEDCTTAEDDNCDGTVNELSAGCTCQPGSTASCYTGPSGTAGVGICHAGTHTCAADGLSYGACTGEVVPQIEICTAQGDEDCNGFACSETLWAQRFGDASAQFGYGVAVDGAGNVYTAGQFAGAMTIGATNLIATGSNDIFAAKFNQTGASQWAKAFGTASSEGAQSIAADAAGNTVIVGNNPGGAPESFGCPQAPSGLWVAQLDPSGACLKAMGCSTSGQVNSRGVALDPMGNIIVAGWFSGTINCGSFSASSNNNSHDIVVVKFAPDGTVPWMHYYGDSALQEAYGLAVDSGGNVVFTGLMNGTVSFGGGNLTDTGGTGSTFLVRLNSNGGHSWSKVFPGSAGLGVAMDALGGPIVTGSLGGSVDFGGGTLTSAGGGDAYVAKYNASGIHTWSKRFGDASLQSGYSVAVNGAGEAVLGMGFAGSVNFGGATLSAAGSLDMAITVVDVATGAHKWSRSYGGAGASVYPYSIGLGPAGEIHVAGFFMGAADFGLGTLTSAGASDAFLMKIAP